MNHVKLFQRSNQKYELEINSLVCKADYTSTTFKGIMVETNAYLRSTDGLARLVSPFQDPADMQISWLMPDATPTAFDGTNNYRISFIRQI